MLLINVKHHLSDTMSLSFVLDFTFEYFKVHVHSNIDALVYMHLLSNLCKNFTFVMHNCNVLLDLYLKQSPADSHLVRVAACASMSDLFARLEYFFSHQKSFLLIESLAINFSFSLCLSASCCVVATYIARN